MNQSLVSWIGAGLALLGLLFGAGQKVGQMQNQIDTLQKQVERLQTQDRYYHGSFPTEAK
jgi:hypothetical protein